MNIKGFIELIRPMNCFLAAIAVFIGYSVSVFAIQLDLTLLIAMASAFLICGAGQAVNDVFDLKIDKKLHPKKPLPSGRVSVTGARYFYMLLFILGILLSFFINSTAFLIAIVFSILLLVYSIFMKEYKYLGNVVVALGTAFTLIYGAAISLNFSVVVFLAGSAFFANWGREIIKDAEDLDVDRGFKKSLPMLVPKEFIKWIVLALYILAIVLAAYVWISGLLSGIFYIGLILISAVFFMLSFLLLFRGKLSEAQLQSKIAMAVALLAFLAGVL